MIGKLNKLIFGTNIPVITLRGVINSSMTDNVTKCLQKIKPANAEALAVVVNSPGGSPSQSEIISEKILKFCKDNDLPLYTFAQDMAASGGYFILSIGDKVYVDSSSLVGSVGVIMQKMNLKGFMDDRQIDIWPFTTNELLLSNIADPFSQLSENQRKEVDSILKKTHTQFIEFVEQNRSQKFKIPRESRDKQIYNADVFSGTKAVELGLADGIGNFQNILYRDFPKAKPLPVSHKSLRDLILEELKLKSGVKSQQNQMSSTLNLKNESL